MLNNFIHSKPFTKNQKKRFELIVCAIEACFETLGRSLKTGGSRDTRFCIFTVREMGAQKKIAVNVFSDAVFLFTIVNGDGSVSEGQWPRASFSGFTVRIPALGEFFRTCNNQILASQWLFTEDL